MTEARWQSVKSLFLDAMALSEDERDAFLRNLQDVDEEVSAHVKALLVEPDTLWPDVKRPCWGDADPAEAPPAITRHTFQPGDQLAGRFEVVEFLGAGGLGEVYRAFDHHKRMFVAIKTLRPGMMADPVALDILRNELNTAQAVTHPNVCRVFDIHFSTPANPSTFFTMELLEGETLSSYLKNHGPLPPDLAMRLIPQILDGLEAIHSKGIVHRDFKSNNIMLTGKDGRHAVVMDFGLARELKPSGDLETTLAANEFAGTPAYMAPEQLRGHAATFLTDIHALGVVLFEMMTGQRPFPGATPMESAAKRLNEKAPSARKYLPSLDRRLDHAISQCLQAEPALRPESVQAVRALVTGRLPAQFSHWQLSLAVGAAAATLAMGAFFAYRQYHAPLTLAVTGIVNQTGDPRLNELANGTATEVKRLLAQSSGLTVSQGPFPWIKRSSLLLDGQLRKASQGFKWEFHLTNSSTNSQVWSKSFEQTPGENPAVMQSQLASDVTAQVKQLQTVAASGSAANKGLALDAYTRGRALLAEGSAVKTQSAIASFQRALELDPQFALALCGMAEAHINLTAYETGAGDPHREQAKNFARQAISIDPALAEAYAALAAIQQQELDHAGSELSYQEALRLKPFFPRLHRWYAGFAIQFANFDVADLHSKIALEQDPYDPANAIGVGFNYFFSGKVKEAIDLMEPNVEGLNAEATRNNLTQAYARMAQLSQTPAERTEWLKKGFGQTEMIVGIERRQKRTQGLLSDRLYALLYAIAGNKAETRRYEARLRQDMDAHRLSPADVAWTYAIEGDSSTALELLEKAYAESPSGLLYIKVNPFLENLKGQPRFDRLIHDLKL